LDPKKGQYGTKFTLAYASLFLKLKSWGVRGLKLPAPQYLCLCGIYSRGRGAKVGFAIISGCMYYPRKIVIFSPLKKGSGSN